MPLRAPDLLAVQTLLEPNAVAVIGASSDARRIGGRPVDYLKKLRFAGPVYPINPSRDTVQGLPAYASIRDTRSGPIWPSLPCPRPRCSMH